jgi:hypothetical protein
VSDPTARPLDSVRTRSGTSFVVAAVVVVVVVAVFILQVSPRLQEDLGLTGVQAFPVPDEPREVPLTLDGREVGVAVHDASGVCAEVTDRAGTTFRTCAEPDPLRPFWAIDAPDEADPAYVIVAGPPDVASVTGTTAAGEALDGLTQARELPAAWTLIPLPDGAVVDRLLALDVDGRELGDLSCGVEDAPTGGPERLAGGCLIPLQD